MQGLLVVTAAVAGVLLGWAVNQLPALKAHVSTRTRVGIVAALAVLSALVTFGAAHLSGPASASPQARAVTPGGSSSTATTPSAPESAPSEVGNSNTPQDTSATTEPAATSDATFTVHPLVLISDDSSGTLQVGDRNFSYTDSADAGIMPTYIPNRTIDGAAATCTSLSVRFSGDQWAQDGSPETAYLKFVQNNRDPIVASVKAGKIATVKVPLDGGPLTVDAAVTNDGGVHNDNVLLDITATCSTPDGQQ